MELLTTRLARAAGLLLVAGCVGTPSVSGVPGASPSPDVPWTPPAALPPRWPGPTAPPRPAVPADLGERIRRLTLAEIVELGLRNNPATREAWANAQSAAAVYGSERGAWLPTVDGDVSASRLKTAASQGRTAVQQSVFTPSVSLTYLLFDFGGRTGRIEGARQRLLSAGFTHNAAIQDVVLQIQVAYFQYLASRALLEAQRTTLAEADTNLTAAEERRRVGVATIADVLQSRTAVSQARLDVETTEGTLQTTRGALASGARAAGQPALRRGQQRRGGAGGGAQRQRRGDHRHRAPGPARPGGRPRRRRGGPGRRGRDPRGAAALAQFRAPPPAAPTPPRIPNGANSYSLSLGLEHSALQRLLPPVRRPRRREFEAEAARRAGASLRQQVVYQVFSAYYALQTATRRVRTAEDLIASAAAIERGGARPLQGGGRHGARPSRRAERPGDRPGPAGGGAAGLERLAGAARPRRGRARSARRHHPPFSHRHHHGDAPMITFDRSPLAGSALVLCLAGLQQGSARRRRRRCRCPGRRRAAAGALRARGHRHGRAAADGGGAGAGERPHLRVDFREGQEVEPGAGALPDRSARRSRRRSPRPRGPGAGPGAGRQRRAGTGAVPASWREGVRHRAAVRAGAHRRRGRAAHCARQPGGREQARLNLQYATIRAPIAGKTGSLRVREGTWCAPPRERRS